MACFFRSSVESFLDMSPSEVIARLTLGYANDGFAQMRMDQPLSWWGDLHALHDALATLFVLNPEASRWQILLEFSIPRKERRIDAVLLTGAAVVILECKRGEARAEALRQVEEYALLLHYFHKPSQGVRIYPLVLSEVRGNLTGARNKSEQHELRFETLPSFWVRPTEVVGWGELPERLRILDSSPITDADGATWDGGAYSPTPTIIEAALALRKGLRVGDIAKSEASEHEIEAVTNDIRQIVVSAETQGEHVICFLTGVPGSGKTLVGLSLAHLNDASASSIHFMSGNGPLVSVLQALFRQQAMRDGVPAAQATIHAKTLIENIHVFAKTYTDGDVERAPSNHVVIFDEAQRAWNLRQNLAKFRRSYSEPEMLLRIMERHQGWAVIIALVGGGQEINSGEAGLEEWGKAIGGSSKDWKVFASPEVMEGGTSTAGHRLFDRETDAVPVQARETLHLRTSNRSLRADNLARWVNHVLDGEVDAAANLRVGDRFPLFLTRSLTVLRRHLREEALGESRFGLAGSSGAARLRAEGVEPSSDFHGAYPWHHWYLSPRTDVRSSFTCEVFATEFEIQGLELDWVGLLWGGDLIWHLDRWLVRDLRHGALTKWRPVRNPDRKIFRKNAYRVLLTRARHGMVIFVPKGEAEDPTRLPEEMDGTADLLVRCGVQKLPE